MSNYLNHKVTRQKTLSLLEELKAGDSKAITFYIPAGLSDVDIKTLLINNPLTREIPHELIKMAANSATGSAIFWGESQKYLITPPFPIKEKYVTNGYDIEPLLSLLTHNFKIGIILVRLGSYSIGTCQGERLIDHKTGTGLVHGRHRQGGSSAARFQRRRQDQTHHFLDRVGEHIRDMFEPQAKTLDYLVYGGARTTILQLQKQCPFLAQFDDRLLPPLLDIPDPKLTVMEKSVTDIWSSKITEWREDETDR